VRTRAQYNGSLAECVLINRTLRGGQVETHNANVVIIGDVNVDSVVRATGDIAVFGRLCGEAHAGKDGDRNATVTAFCMEPTQIRIADAVALGVQSRLDNEDATYPEVARIEKDNRSNTLRIRIDPSGQYGQLLSGRGKRRRAARLGSTGGLIWNAPAKAARLTGLYLIAAGLSLFLAPNWTFGLLFDVRTITRGWIQVFGTIATALGFYCKIHDCSSRNLAYELV